ncbi:MAG: thioredoxin family protein [Bacteroidales bacterium]|nr:thioredoxin family protein [Bacteroidales bacterium]
MRRLILIILLSLLSFALCAQNADSVKMAALDAKLEEYFAALETESLDIKRTECDFLISSCTTDDVRNHVAVRLYAHFMQSMLMGDEAVAVHLADNWFIPGKVSFPDEIDLMNAKIFAEFNRQSLLGCKAPGLVAEDSLGRKVEVPLGLSDRYRILYIYSPDCATCSLQTMLMDSLFSRKSYPVDLIAFNSDDNTEAWVQYRRDRLSFDGIRVMHFRDPSLESDFQRKYGVLQTPRMFLIDKNGIIVGRGLDAPALEKLLDATSDLGVGYGSKSSADYFDAVLESFGDELRGSDIRYFIGKLEEATLESADTAGFRQMAGDMLYYLAGKRGEAFKDAEAFVVDSMVLSRPDEWRFADDSLTVVDMAMSLKHMLSLAPVGARVPDVRVYATVLRAGRKPAAVHKKLRSLLKGKRNYVLFHTAGCAFCEAELAAADSVASEKGVRVILVDMDKLTSLYPEEANRLLDAFDLSVLPFIMETNHKGRVVRKYLSLNK